MVVAGCKLPGAMLVYACMAKNQPETIEIQQSVSIFGFWASRRLAARPEGWLGRCQGGRLGDWEPGRLPGIATEHQLNNTILCES